MTAAPVGGCKIMGVEATLLTNLKKGPTDKRNINI